MKNGGSQGLTLVELLIAMSIATITGVMIMQLVLSFQTRICLEIKRNDLYDRSERLVRFMANEICDSGFIIGTAPTVAGGAALTLVHDSLPGNPEETLPFSIICNDFAGDDDQITILKAISFSPSIHLAQTGNTGDNTVHLNRRPNRSPGSSREILPAPEAINHLAFASNPACFTAQYAAQALRLSQPLIESIPAGTEVLAVRAYRYFLDPFADSNRLRQDDFTSRNILDDAVDGLQFEYLVGNGALVSQPLSADDIKAIKVSLLVRDLKKDPSYTNDIVYSLGNRTYGPFHDHYRRRLVSRLVEVKNNGR